MPLENGKLPPRPVYPVLDEGMYQVVIKDVTERDGTNYQGEPEKQYQFDLEVLNPENRGHKLKVWTSRKFSPAKEGRSESKLYSIVSKTSLKGVQAIDLDVNDLIGKQLIVVVAIKEKDDEKRNRVTGFMSVKTDLPVQDTAQMVEEVMSEPKPKSKKESNLPKTKTDEINLDDIPF